jgi:dTDP-4-dehydrorhamnose reductase
MHKHFVYAGIDPADLDWFLENTCPPDIIGANYYVTSERFLDERVHAYPMEARGHNHRQSYGDVAACHVRGQGMYGLDRLLMEYWERFHLPIAVTEAHLGCTREEQVRWLVEMWEEAERARSWGADIRAMTPWCMFGAYHWNKLVTCDKGAYESGIFDVRAPRPRPTALAHVCKQLGSGKKPQHPLLDTPGWWRRASRFIFPVSEMDAAERLQAVPPMPMDHVERPILLLGKETPLGDAIHRSCEVRALRTVSLRNDQLDTGSKAALAKLFGQYRPWAVIDAGHLTDVDAAERDPHAYRLRNVQVREQLAELCAANGARFMMFASDQAFDGSPERPYVESDAAHPLNEFGRCDAGAERLVLSALPTAMIVRTGPLFGVDGVANQLKRALEEIHQGRRARLSAGRKLSPTYLPDVVCTSLDLLIDEAEGVWHLATPGEMDWADFARRIAERADLDQRLIVDTASHERGPVARRPRYSALGSERQSLMPCLDDAIERYLSDLRSDGIISSPQREVA